MKSLELVEKKKKKRTLGGFPVVGVYFGLVGDDSGGGGEVAETSQGIISKRGIAPGTLIDLTKQFPTYISLIGQVKEITSAGKLRIVVVQAESNREIKHPVGTVISVAPNYINKSSIINKSQVEESAVTTVFILEHLDGDPVVEFDDAISALNYLRDLKELFPDRKYSIREQIKLNAPHRKIDRKELHSYLDRIKTDTKTKKDKFSPIIHGSNIKAITKSDDPDDAWDLTDLAQQITTRPRALLGTNAKMTKSKTEGEIVYDLTLPALSGIVVDEGTGDFVEITTCPGAGECQLFCYARKGGYIMFPASSMSSAQALNFLVNDPKGYSDMVNREIQAIKSKTDRAGIQLVVRWHDAGDFFSKEYLDLAFDVARNNPEVQFYAYTKIGDVATANAPSNFIINFSSGSKRREEKKIEIHKDKTQQPVKAGVTVPKDMFYDLIARQGIKLIKDAQGRTQFKSPEALEMFKDRLAKTYKVNPDTIITYDQMLNTPIGNKPHWNVIVQPGAGDRAANRRDVVNSFLMFH